MGVAAGHSWHHVCTRLHSALVLRSVIRWVLVRWELAGWVDMHWVLAHGRLCTSLGCRGSLQTSADRSHSWEASAAS